MLKKLTIFFSVILITMISCKQEIKKKSNNFKTLVSDTSVRHRKFNEIDFSREMSSMLSLATITEGVDSFELRIWVTSMWLPKYVNILKYSQGKWSNYEYSYYPKEKIIDSMRVYSLPIPKEVEKITTFLKQDKILNLPSQAAIPNFHDNIGDGQTCTIEISTKTFYKALQYHCPEHFSKEPNNVKFMEIIKFLNTHFKFYIPWCKPGE